MLLYVDGKSRRWRAADRWRTLTIRSDSRRRYSTIFILLYERRVYLLYNNNNNIYIYYMPVYIILL